MEKRMKIAEFADLVGTTPKTIYARLQNNGELPIKEQLNTVSEKIKGREITLIVTDLEQINLYKEIYGKNSVIDGEYYETLTDNNSYQPVKTPENGSFPTDIIDRLITLNNEYNNRIERVNDELITYKSKVLLLEDKASREGFYIKENNELKTVIENNNNRYNRLFITLITVIILAILIIAALGVALVFYYNKPPQVIETEKVVTVEKPVYVKGKR